jgi:hypothetical protein
VHVASRHWLEGLLLLLWDTNGPTPLQRKERKHAKQPGPEGNPNPKSPKVTEVTFEDVGLGFPSMEPFCHSVV